MPQSPRTLAELTNLARLGDGRDPASSRPNIDDSTIVDLSGLPLYAAGTAPLELPKLGAGVTGVVIPNGEFGGLILTLDPGAKRPFSGVVGRPMIRDGASGLFAWRGPRAWGLAVLEFYEWRANENPLEQIQQIIAWSHGFAQPTGDVVVTATITPATGFKTSVQIQPKAAYAAQQVLAATNVGTTIRNRSNLLTTVGAPASIGTIYLNSLVANFGATPAATSIVLAPGEFFDGWTGPLAIKSNGEAFEAEIDESLA